MKTINGSPVQNQGRGRVVFMVKTSGREDLMVSAKNDIFPHQGSFFNPVPGENKTSDGEFPWLPPYKYQPGSRNRMEMLL
jgi:hypothetical protein